MGCGKDRAKAEDMRENSRECHLMPLRTELEEVMKRWGLENRGAGWRTAGPYAEICDQQLAART